MKGQELRIGNLLYFCNTVDMAIVELIHKKHFDCRDEYGIFTPNGKYEPITLTEEWLLKFGFETETFRLDKRVFYQKNKFMYNTGSKTLCYDGSNMTHIKYVHQLQNLYYALTGEELK